MSMLTGVVVVVVAAAGERAARQTARSIIVVFMSAPLFEGFRCGWRPVTPTILPPLVTSVVSMEKTIESTLSLAKKSLGGPPFLSCASCAASAPAVAASRCGQPEPSTMEENPGFIAAASTSASVAWKPSRLKKTIVAARRTR